MLYIELFDQAQGNVPTTLYEDWNSDNPMLLRMCFQTLNLVENNIISFSFANSQL